MDQKLFNIVSSNLVPTINTSSLL